MTKENGKKQGMPHKPKTAPTAEIVGQLVGIKNLKIAGGWRLEIDLLDSRLADVLRVTALVNERQACKITLEPIGGENG